MDKIYKTHSGVIFKVTDDGNFYRLDIDGTWEHRPSLESLYYENPEEYEEIILNEDDIPKIDKNSIEWTYDTIEGVDVKYNKKYRLYYVKTTDNRWIEYFALEELLKCESASGKQRIE